MKPKIVELNGKQYVEVSDGKPIYVHDDGKEVPFDAPQAVSTIAARNAEAKKHREEKEAAETRLKAFEGIEDADAARQALETVANLDAGKLVQAGKVEEIKAAAKKAAEDQVAAAQKKAADDRIALEKERDTYKNQLYDEKVGSSFKGSKFVADRLTVPADLVQAQFGRHFKVEEGKIVAYDSSGNKVYSRAKPGELADFDEALETLVDGYAHRNSILKGTGGGAGAKGGEGGNNGAGGKTMSRAEFDKLDPATQMAKMTTGGVTVVD